MVVCCHHRCHRFGGIGSATLALSSSLTWGCGGGGDMASLSSSSCNGGSVA